MTLSTLSVRELATVLAQHTHLAGAPGWPTQYEAIVRELERRCGEEPAVEAPAEELGDL